MELNATTRSAVLNRIQQALGNAELEFEANFGGFGVTENGFKRVLNALSTSEGFERSTQEPTLDMRIQSSNVRLSLVGKGAISRYCQTTKLVPEEKYTAIEKTTVEPTLYENDHGLHFNLRKEKPIDADTPAIIEAFQHNIKQFRFKQRVSFHKPGHPFRVDCTIVNTHVKPGNDIASAGVFKTSPIYEIEVELLQRKEPADVCLQRMLKLLELLYKNLDNSMYVVSLKLKENVLAQYLQLIDAKVQVKDAMRMPNKFFTGPKPVSLMWEHLMPAKEGKVSILENYTVTDKADGERMLFFIADSGKCYVIDNRLVVRYTGIQSKPELAGTLVDGEYVDKWLIALKSDLHSVNMAAFMAFDIYYFRKKSTSNLPLSPETEKTTRLGFIKELSEYLKGASTNAFVQFKCKTFVSGDVFKAVRQVLKTEKLYETDGLIFTPTDLPVGANSVGAPPNMKNTWARAMKWKPPEQNTIDFLVRLGAVVKDESEQTMRAASLYVGFLDVFGEHIDPYVALYPSDKVPNGTYKEKSFAETLLPLQDGNKLVATSGDAIQNNSVVEFAFSDGKWVPLRVRHDKTQLYQTTGSIAGTANDIKVATSIWKTIVTPVTLDLLTGETPVSYEKMIEDDGGAYYITRDTERDKLMLKPMLDFHNHIKGKMLLNKYKGNSLFDVGVGKAGDLNKWLAAGFKVVVGVDKSEDGILNATDGAYARLMGMKMKKKGSGNEQYVFAVWDAGKPIKQGNQEAISNQSLKDITNTIFGMVDKSRVKKLLGPLYNIGNGAFDVVSCQFAVHYFFKDADTLEAFCANVATRLKHGGHFIGTCMDGKAVVGALSKAPSGVIQGKKNGKVIWVIKKKYTSEGGTGKEIEVFVESINNMLTEYVVDFDLLVAKLKEHHVELKARGSFREFYTADRGFTEDESTFSFMNMYFVFVKEQNVQQK